MTKMTYAEAVACVNRNLSLGKEQDEALAVLRRAGKVMGEIEKANPVTVFADMSFQGRDGGSVSKQTKAILRAALEARESK